MAVEKTTINSIVYQKALEGEVFEIDSIQETVKYVRKIPMMNKVNIEFESGKSLSINTHDFQLDRIVSTLMGTINVPNGGNR